MGRTALRWYLTASLLVTAVYTTLPDDVRPSAFTAIALVPVVMVAVSLRRIPAAHRGPANMLLIGLGTLTVGNITTAVQAATHGDRNGVALWIITLGHVAMLLAALSIVRQRGRNDIGGVIDTAVVSIGAASVLWTVAVQPRLATAGADLASQGPLLVIMLSMSGILGALIRLEQMSVRPLLALRLFIVVLLLSMLGNVALAVTGTFVLQDRPGWIEGVFLLAYVALGFAAADGSINELLTPGSRAEPQLTWGRLVVLGAAIAVNPVVAGVQQLLGRDVDALLLSLGTAAVVPLVMTRVGWLSAKRTQAEAALIRQATHDALTGLPNRAELLTRLTAALAADPPPVVLFCDLNGFKAVNDRLGHLAGDQLLRHVADRLTGCIREGETLARYGGDEFVFLCPSPPGPDVADRVAARIEHAFTNPFEVAGDFVVIGVSIGAATAEPGSDAVSTVRRADEAMYVAKRERQHTGVVSLRVA